jgi:hypothetical protein
VDDEGVVTRFIVYQRCTSNACALGTIDGEVVVVIILVTSGSLIYGWWLIFLKKPILISHLSEF